MKRKSIFIAIIMGLFCGFVFAQQSKFSEIFPNEKIKVEKKMELQIRSVFTSNKHFAVIEEGDNIERYPKIITFFDSSGNQLWQKNIDEALRVSLGDQSDKVLVMEWTTINKAPFQKCTCFDLQGNKLWSIDIPKPGLFQSSDGKYAITYPINIGGDDDDPEAHFQIFDMETAQEIPIKIPDKNNGILYAKFLNNTQIALLIQHVDAYTTMPERTKKKINKLMEARKEARRLRAAGKNKEARELERKYRYRRIELLPVSVITSEIISLGIYDIPSNSLVKVTEVLKENGPSPFLNTGTSLKISKDGEKILVTGKARDQKNHIFIFDKFGDLVWEMPPFEKFGDVAFVDSENLLIVKGSEDKRRPFISFYNISEKRKKWEIKIEGSKIGDLKEVFIDDNNQLFIQSGRYGYNSKMWYLNRLDAENGSILSEEFQAKNFILTRMDRKKIIINRMNNSVILSE